MYFKQLMLPCLPNYELDRSSPSRLSSVVLFNACASSDGIDPLLLLPSLVELSPEIPPAPLL